MPDGKRGAQSRSFRHKRAGPNDPFWDPLNEKKSVQSRAQQEQSIADEWTNELRYRQKKEPGLKDTWKKRK